MMNERLEAKETQAQTGTGDYQRWFKHVINPINVADQRLISNCHPADYINPPGHSSGQRYNLVVIGGGAAGLVSAGGCGLLGGRAALIERGLLGGDCLNTGCVPSKGLIRAARGVYEAQQASRFGLMVDGGSLRVDFGVAMERMRQLRANISINDSVVRMRDKYGVDIYLGEARFTAPDAVEVGGQTLKFAKAVIATGGRPAIPSIPGLAGTRFHTSETIFNLEELPRRLVIIGGGPIACELAQAFHRFGSSVTILNAGARLLLREDEAVAGIIESRFIAEGLSVHHSVNIRQIEAGSGTSARISYFDLNKMEHQIEGDCLLVAVGRLPNVEGLNLEAAHVAVGDEGVRVDDRLRTTNRRIYAAGDVCSALKFTHLSDAMARVAIRNALLMGRQRLSHLVIPRVTFTDPEVAQVGLTKQEAVKKGKNIETLTSYLDDNDRAILDGDVSGLISIQVDHSSGRIVGGTIVARQAGEMIGQLTLAITAGLSCADLAKTIQPYPTLSDGFRRIGDTYQMSRLGPLSRLLLRRWLAWSR